MTAEDDVTVVALTTAGDEHFDGLFASNAAAVFGRARPVRRLKTLGHDPRLAVVELEL